jgi:hypothetical protein
VTDDGQMEKDTGDEESAVMFPPDAFLLVDPAAKRGFEGRPRVQRAGRILLQSFKQAWTVEIHSAEVLVTVPPHQKILLAAFPGQHSTGEDRR